MVAEAREACKPVTPGSQKGDARPISVQVLMELKEYAYAEVDVDFVRKAVRAIGRCALKIESSAERCVAVLVDLIQVGLWPQPFASRAPPLLRPCRLRRPSLVPGVWKC